MIAHNNPKNRIIKRTLVDELLAESHKAEWCPCLKVDDMGPYCGYGLEEDFGEPYHYGPGGEEVMEIREIRRLVCDTASLQLWCLDKKDAIRCIYSKGELFK